jgi:hypothetical protein
MNIAAIFKSLSLITSIMPLISSFIQQVEALLPSAPGTAKLAAVIAAVNTYLVKIEADVDVIAAAKSELAPIIAGLVALYNASGLFKKSTPVAAAAVQAPAPAATV